MKKLVTLLLAAGLVFSAANSASAVEVKASGNMNFAFDWSQNLDTTKVAGRTVGAFQDNKDRGINQKHFGAVQRMRLTLDFVMSENLSATYQAQVGTFTWGGAATGNTLGGNPNEGNGGVLGSRSGNIVTRLAYLDWLVPNTSVKVRMGQQAVAMPSFTFGSPVLDDTATGVVVAAPVTDNFGLTGMWLRAASGFRRGAAVSTARVDDNTDLFGLIGDVKGDGFQVQPWVMVGLIGKDSDVLGKGVGNATAWWAGISGELSMFDPFRLTADFVYNDVDVKHSGEDKTLESAGWYAALGAEYQTAYGTPALKGWYASGDSKKHANRWEDGSRVLGNKRSGRLVELSGGFNATSTFYDGSWPLAKHLGVTSPNGSWGVSAQWNDISFVENLSHALSVTYVQGTNNKNNLLNPSEGYLTTKDSLVELDFNTVYNIYQNLAVALDLGYIIQDFDGKNLARNILGPNTTEKVKFSDAWRATVGFQYTF